jgi:DNA-binding transcriptional regulator YhcF (GntR family)
MSYNAMDWAFEQKCSDAAGKLVLITIAKHANDRGEAWPSIQRISAMTNLHRRTVERKITQLKKDGLLLVKNRGKDGKKASNLYKLVDAAHSQSYRGTTPHRINNNNKSSVSLINDKETDEKVDWNDFANKMLGKKNG